MIDTHTVIRFFNQECSPEERLRVMSWVNESKEHAEQFFRWEEYYHLGKSHAVSDATIRKAEKQLFQRIHAEQERTRLVRTLNTWVKYAAVFVLLLTFAGLTTWYFTSVSQDSWITAQTQAGEKIEITLPDNTKVWLNENSQLKYPPKFKKNKRSIRLSGEAYFEVTKDKHKPFTVQGQDMSVQVLGTKFNFRNAPSCRIAEASLIEGEVKVKGNRDEGSITLSPGQKVELNTMTKQMKVFDTDAAIDAVWHNNLIPFKNADLFHIAAVLEKVYKIHFILSPDIDRSTTYSGVIKRKDSIEDVLKLLQNTIGLQYKVHKGNIFLSSKAVKKP